MTDIKRQTIFGFAWRLIQNAGTQIITFIVSIVLARILTPDDYGLVSLITVFTSIAFVFVTTGFSSAVIQRNNISQTDTSTLFYSGIITAFILYAILYFSAPAIAQFYGLPELVKLFRLNSISVIICSFYSIQQALFTRKLQFKKTFLISLVSAILQGISGISLALCGFGAWALVISTLVNYCVACIATWISSEWRPTLEFSQRAFNEMFFFSFKVLLSGLLDTIFQNIRSLVIGKQYTSADLAYYNRGYTFPSIIMIQIDGAMTTVLFSSLSKFQDDWESGLRILRRSMSVSLYVCVPMMAGMCAVAKPLILLLLTDKWIPSVPYMQLVAIMCSLWPLSAKRHALNSKGYSGVSLMLNLISQFVSLFFLLLTFRISVSALIMSTIFSSLMCEMLFMFVYQKYLNYMVVDQLRDALPAYILSTIMFCAVYMLQFLNLNYILTLVMQIVIGVLVYVILSIATRNQSFEYLKLNFRKIISEKKVNG